MIKLSYYIHKIKRIAFWKGYTSAKDLESLANVSNKTARSWSSDLANQDPDFSNCVAGSTQSSIKLNSDSIFSDSTKSALENLHAAHVLNLPAQSVLPIVPYHITDELIGNIDINIFRRLINAIQNKHDIKITYVSFQLNKVSCNRSIYPAKLVFIEGRWHLQAVDKDINKVRDFVLNRIIRIFDEVPAKKDFSDIISIEYKTITLQVIPHHRLSQEQTLVVAEQFNIPPTGGNISMPKYQEWYFRKKWVADIFDMPPKKLLQIKENQ